MNAIEQRYRTLTPKSAELAQRAERVMPGGDTRTATFHRPYVLTIARGEGPCVWDVDGNRYIDLIGNYTSLVHGHAYPPIRAAIERVARDGTAWPARSPEQLELAELLCARIGSVERLRFTNSGTEANMMAVQAARRLTGRRLILMARYGYHGSYEDFEVGMTGQEGERTLLADFGEATAFEALLGERGKEIAAVVLEPVLGSAGVIAPPPGFLARVSEAAHRAGALFVLDEVITLRLAEGGAQALHNVKPDITTMGKIIGGGLAVGALGGSEQVMACFDPRNRGALMHSGTFNGNRATCAAGIASMRELTPERIAAMDQLANRLAQELKRAATAAELPFSVNRVGSLMNIFFVNQAPAATVVRDDAKLIANFHLAALNHGLFIAPRGLIAMSTVMDDALVAEIVERAAEAMRDLAAVCEG
jgi:glutamate-1-semialdehyde 2,1-aminomutase